MEKLFDLLNPLLKYIDSGKFFKNPVKWLYIVFAVLNAITPFYILIGLIDSELFKYASGKIIVGVILMWIILLIGCLLLGLLWWMRKDQLNKIVIEGTSFPVTPIFAHILRTFGEWLGLFIGVVMFVISIVGIIFAGSEIMNLGSIIPLQSGLFGIIIQPILGYLIILFSHYLSEQIKVFVAIANNTKKD